MAYSKWNFERILNPYMFWGATKSIMSDGHPAYTGHRRHHCVFFHIKVLSNYVLVGYRKINIANKREFQKYTCIRYSLTQCITVE